MKTSDQALVDEQHRIWNELVGEAWVDQAAIHDRLAEPFGLAAMDALGDVTGTHVLDVGCGTGATTGQLLDRGAADVLGVDLSEPMIAAARRVARPGAAFEVGDVVGLDRPAAFDAVYSRFGVMFFADPITAFRRLRTFAADGARLAFCCWGPPPGNPIMALPVMAAVPVLGPPRFAAPGEPGPFSLAPDDVAGDIVRAAGWQEVRVDELTAVVPHPAGDADAVAESAMTFNPLLAEGLRQHPDRRIAARAAIVDALRPFEREGIVHLAADVRIVRART